MNRKRLISIIESYGADEVLWPEAERAAALAELSRQPDAEALLAGPAGVDAALARLKAATHDPALPPGFLATLQTIPLAQRQRRLWIEVPDWLKAWPQLSSLAAGMMLAGFLAGMVLPANDQPSLEIEIGLAVYGTSMNTEVGS
jgi:hypothetical protein